jgi:pimeloyl-ACP methyl ester carboxylesterase
MNKLIRLVLVLFLISTITSCQLNKIALQPWNNSLNKKEFSWKKGNNSLQLKFIGDNLQPYFFKNKDTLQNDFSIKSFYFETENHRKINAWLLKSKTEKPKASIFALHGNSGNLNSQHQNFSNLTQFGYQIFIFDYSGFGYSEGKSTRKNALEDAFSVFQFFENLEEIQNLPKIIYGQSIGGNFAIPVAAKNQNSIEGLVLEGTFMNFKNIPNYYLPVLGGLIIKNNYDNRQNLKKITIPILIIHSKEDRVIPFKLGKMIFKNANQPKEFLEITRPHINGIKFYSKEISQKIDSLILGK